MSLKKDLKKLEKLYRAKRKAIVVKFSKYLKKQKLTTGDLVFVYTMILVLFLVLSVVGVFSKNISDSMHMKGQKQSYGSSVNRKPKNQFRSVVLGIRSAEANTGSVKSNNPESIKVPILMYHRVNDTLIAFNMLIF